MDSHHRPEQPDLEPQQPQSAPNPAPQPPAQPQWPDRQPTPEQQRGWSPPPGNYGPPGAPPTGYPHPPAYHIGAIKSDGAVWVPAGLLPRLIAFCIDWALLSIIVMLVVMLVNIPEPSEAEAMDLSSKLVTKIMANPMELLDPSSQLTKQVEEFERPLKFKGYINLAVAAAYFIIFNGLLGASIGKLILGLRILRADGRPIGFAGAVGRYFLYLISAKLIYTLWWMWFNPEKRTLYDQLLRLNVYRPLLPAAAVNDPGTWPER